MGNFLSVFLYLINYFIFLGLYHASTCTSEILKEQTLIYDFDFNHGINYYCQFASKKELNGNHIQRKCYSKNKEMHHILPDGTKTFPYVHFGSNIGFVLKCGDIPGGSLDDSCSKYVYTNCSYTCETSNLTYTATCNLLGPWENVTSQWSVEKSCLIPNPAQDTGSNLTESDSMDAPVIQAPPQSLIFIPIVIGAFLLVGLVLVSAVCYYRKKKKRRLSAGNPSQEAQQEPLTATCEQQAQPVEPVTGHTHREANNNEANGSEHIRSQTGIAELQDNMYHNVHCNVKSKGFGDKDPLSILNGCSKMNCESLNDICVEAESGTVTYNRSQNGLFAHLDSCNATVEVLKQQKNSYRKWLRAELEVIPGRTREQALIGYMEDNYEALGYVRNEIKLLEKSYETRVDQKVSDEFLLKLAAYGVKLGSLVTYFYQHGNKDAITAILEVHRDCQFCNQFARL